MPLKNILPILIFGCSFAILSGQTINSRIVDKSTNSPIPYATIELAENNGIIANEEGKFTIIVEDLPVKTDSIYISSMGFERIGLSITQKIDSVLYLLPKEIELDGVLLSNKKLSAEEIMEKVEDNIETNYDFGLSKKKLFFRQTNQNNIEKLKLNYKESTIEELNKEFIDSIRNSIPKKSTFYLEALCNFYGNSEQQRLEIIKGARLYDRNNVSSVQGLFKKLEVIFKENIKPDSYIKVKSGLFSQKVEVDSILNANKGSEHQENLFFKSRKNNLTNIFANLITEEDAKLDIIDHSGRYEFTLNDYTAIDDKPVYIINFEPKRGADFSGTLYVDMEDFAIVRVDYKNVKPLKSVGLFGFSYREHLYNGKIMYAKGKNGKYYPRFIERIVGKKIGVDRPLKVVEKNKNVRGRRKQNELLMDIDVLNSVVTKSEVVVFDHQNISESTYLSAKENKTSRAKYMAKYDPSFWSGYNIIEPNQAIRTYSAKVEE
ncbi:MAG: hypothetical protein CL613_04160 [Aquimarina sp.]|nr:hypothetical protein [Aquimarina sp.]